MRGWILGLGCGVALLAACATAPPSVVPPSTTTAAPTAAMATAAPVTTSAPEAPPPEPVEEDVGPVIVAPHPAADLFADLPVGADQRERLCKRGHRDRISQLFCGDQPPTIAGLRDLQKALGLSYDNLGLAESQNFTGNGREGTPPSSSSATPRASRRAWSRP